MKKKKNSRSRTRSHSRTASSSSSVCSIWTMTRSWSQEIIGNVDEDGYLRRDLVTIVQDVNLTNSTAITVEKGEQVLRKIQHMDPVGIAARSLQECLLVQLEVTPLDPAVKVLATRLLTKFYDDFTMRHFEELAKKLGIALDDLKQVIELIQHLNPKPGEGEFSAHENYIVPDFLVTKTKTDFVISLNDRNIPPLRINKAYKDLMPKRREERGVDRSEGLHPAAVRGREVVHQLDPPARETMLKVMRTIVEKQHEYFDTGEGLRPMIYKDIAEVISMDISTISRVVNSKYVQTDYGVFSLRHFFSDSISTTDGDKISNKEVKKKLKTLIDAEDPLPSPERPQARGDAQHQEGAEHRAPDGGQVPRSDAHSCGPSPPQAHLTGTTRDEHHPCHDRSRPHP